MSLVKLKRESSFFTQSFISLSLLVFIFSRNNADFTLFFSSAGNALSEDAFSFQNPSHYLRLFVHIFGNKSILSLMANAGFLFYLAPIIEQKYTKAVLLGMYFTTALVSASLNSAFFPHAIQGGTGIAFLYLLLALIDTAEKKELSISLFLIFILFLLKEFYLAIDNQDISGFAHFVAAFVASILAFIQGKKPKKRSAAKREVRGKT